MDLAFRERAHHHWTPERELKVTGGKHLPLKPSTAPDLLRVLGLLNADASMPADATRKFSQINHMTSLLLPVLSDLMERHETVRVLDIGCGTSYLALLVAWLARERWAKRCHVVGIDRNPKVIATSTARASQLGLSDSAKFTCAPIQEKSWAMVYEELFPAPSGVRPNLVVSLHACDTATDYAIALGIAAKADAMALAPCCHAELARKWQTLVGGAHPFGPVFRSPNLRRDTAANITDAMRMLLTRSRGYEVTATEFVPSAHTPKNRLLLCKRRGNYSLPAQTEYQELKTSLGGQGILLEDLLGPCPTALS